MDKDIDIQRHGLAHVMAAAVKEMWPQAKFGIGPSIDNGFYYDFDLDSDTISDNDLKKIEKGMHKLIQKNIPFIKTALKIDDAIEWSKDNDQPYKEELLGDLKKTGTTSLDGTAADAINSPVKEVTFYTLGNFMDLCRGPHVDSTKELTATFKLTRTAGAYWRGNEKNPQMQRIYAVAFATSEELEKYLLDIEEAKKRDHRKLGKDLDLYTMSPLVGAGLPLFTPRGTVMRDLLSGYSNQLRQDCGFEKVWTPHITKIDLYKKSGHWAKFGEELFLVKSQETSDEMALKPMNCPHHAQIFDSKPRSYKELPVRYLETTTDYRDEKTGELGGLERVRSLTQDDSHIFCSKDQVEQEISNLMSVARKLYSSLGMKLRVRLSYRGEGKGYLGDASLWESAQAQLKQAVIKNDLDYFEQNGEAAFYGPKIDFMATDAIGREHQVATVQLDFVQPSRFGLTYTSEDGSQATPVMIHCAILGSIERFMSVFIEHTAGWFPFWVAPEQIRILTINDTVLNYVDKIVNELKNVTLMNPVRFNPLRYRVDDRNQSLGKKIREATSMKIPMQVIVGPKDEADNVVSIRTRNKEEKVPLAELCDYIKQYNESL